MSNFNLKYELDNSKYVVIPGNENNETQFASPSGFKVEFQFEKTEAWYKLSKPDGQYYFADVTRDQLTGKHTIYFDGPDFAKFISSFSDTEVSEISAVEFLKGMIIKYRESKSYYFQKPELAFRIDTGGVF